VIASFIVLPPIEERADRPAAQGVAGQSRGQSVLDAVLERAKGRRRPFARE
jgi:hypothetical protein